MGMTLACSQTESTACCLQNRMGGFYHFVLSELMAGWQLKVAIVMECSEEGLTEHQKVLCGIRPEIVRHPNCHSR